jgi:hypothetical protein
MSANQPKTREEYKKIKLEEQKKHEESKPSLKVKQVKVRLIPIWLRLIILVVLILISTTAGALVGYGPLGGGKAADIFKESTWTHIIDLVDKEK